MRKIVIFSGTTEGRELSYKLSEMGTEYDLNIIVCVATEYGKEEQGIKKGIEIQSGRKSIDEMKELLLDAEICVDATHPYATEVTKNIKTACKEVNVFYLRLQRAVQSNGLDAVYLKSADEVSEFLENTEGNILLTTGSKELVKYKNINPERLFARVLPLDSSLILCKDANIPSHNIIAMQGPFSEELNIAMIHQFDIRYMVTKDGGAAGGFIEKINAAHKCGIKTIIIERPEETGFTPLETLTKIKEILKCN